MEIEVTLRHIYRAAHKSIPAQAQRLSTQGNDIASAHGIATQAATTGHPISSDISTLAEEIVFRLGQVVTTMNTCALELDKVADDFAATDDQAAAWLREHQSWIAQNGYGGEPAAAPVPTYPEA